MPTLALQRWRNLNFNQMIRINLYMTFISNPPVRNDDIGRAFLLFYKYIRTTQRKSEKTTVMTMNKMLFIINISYIFGDNNQRFEK